MKPDVLEQIKVLTANREMQINNENRQGNLCREINGKQ